MRALMTRRLVLVTGKGGVGKSTCATALAIAAAREGKRVLLCELGVQAVAPELLGGEAGSHVPHRPLPQHMPGLWLSHLDAHQALQAYLREHLKSSMLVQFATNNRVLARLWKAAPSVNEMSLLNALYSHMGEKGRLGKHRFEQVIVDMPATGHTLAMLGVPRGILGMVRVGSLARRARDVDALLHDETQSAICIVTLAEELPVNESVELAQRLAQQLDMRPSHVFINCVMPELFSDVERRLLERLSCQVAPGPGRHLLDVADEGERRRRLQKARIDELQGLIDARFVEILYRDGDGMNLVEGIADRLMAA